MSNTLYNISGRFSMMAARLFAGSLLVALSSLILAGAYYQTMPWRAEKEAAAIKVKAAVLQEVGTCNIQGTDGKQ